MRQLRMLQLQWTLPTIALTLSGCATMPDNGGPRWPTVYADVETQAVQSADDAADDPAIWINAEDPENSLVLGTDKQAGLNAYRLDGSLAQFLPSGRLNNVDVRRNVSVGEKLGDYAAASNRSDDTIVIFSIVDGRVSEKGRIASALAEPYGLCVGAIGGNFLIFVTHKSGDLIAYKAVDASNATIAGRLKFESQLEGCVFDEPTSRLYVGEEARGVWRTVYTDEGFSSPLLIAEVSGSAGLVADVEGLAVRRDDDGDYLIASSQGDNSFVIYDLASETALLKFSVAEFAGIDGAEETDGVDAASAPLGPFFPEGVFIVQDGVNTPASDNQNFKFIDWRRIAELLRSEGVRP